MSNIYVNQSSLQIRLDTKVSLTAATSLKIKYQKPTGVTGFWTASQYLTTTSIYYNLISTELDVPGVWKFWAYVTFPDGRTAPGDAVTQEVDVEGIPI